MNPTPPPVQPLAAQQPLPLRMKDSEYPGSPITSSAAAGGSGDAASDYELPIPTVDQGFNILLAMPPSIFQTKLERELTRRGYQPLLARRSDELLKLLHTLPARLLILDRLPGVANNYIFCKECLALHPALNILLLADRLTGLADARRLMALRYGALDMISRDEADIGRLVERIEVLIPPPIPQDRAKGTAEPGPAGSATGASTATENRPPRRSWLQSVLSALQRPVLDRSAETESAEAVQKIGARLVSRKLITEEQLAIALQEQKILGLRLGEVCVYAGWISYADLLMVLDRPQHLLGQILVASGHLSFAQLRIALQEQEETGQHLATIIHGHHWVSREVLAQALNEQRRLEQTTPPPAELEPPPAPPPAASDDGPTEGTLAAAQAWAATLARRASLLCSRNQLAEASHLLQGGLQRFPNHPGLLLAHAVVLHRQGQIGEAAQVLEGLVQQQPQSAAALTLLGTVRRALQDRTGARQAYSRAYQILSQGHRRDEAQRIQAVLAELEAEGSTGNPR